MGGNCESHSNVFLPVTWEAPFIIHECYAPLVSLHSILFIFATLFCPQLLRRQIATKEKCVLLLLNFVVGEHSERIAQVVCPFRVDTIDFQSPLIGSLIDLWIKLIIIEIPLSSDFSRMKIYENGVEDLWTNFCDKMHHTQWKINF